MKRMTLAAAIVAALFLLLTVGAPRASADTILTIGDAYYLGHINDGIPSNLADEVTYVNSLLDLVAGANFTTCSQAVLETCDRLNSTLNATGFSDVTVAMGTKSGDNPSNLGIDITGKLYILGKYDAANAGSYVWYVGGLTGTVALPANAVGGQYGLSHYTTFGTTTVPDGGMTLMLLGGALVGLEALRRRLRA